MTYFQEGFYPHIYFPEILCIFKDAFLWNLILQPSADYESDTDLQKHGVDRGGTFH